MAKRSLGDIIGVMAGIGGLGQSESTQVSERVDVHTQVIVPGLQWLMIVLAFLLTMFGVALISRIGLLWLTESVSEWTDWVALGSTAALVARGIQFGLDLYLRNAEEGRGTWLVELTAHAVAYLVGVGLVIGILGLLLNLRALDWWAQFRWWLGLALILSCPQWMLRMMTELHNPRYPKSPGLPIAERLLEWALGADEEPDGDVVEMPAPIRNGGRLEGMTGGAPQQMVRVRKKLARVISFVEIAIQKGTLARRQLYGARLRSTREELTPEIWQECTDWLKERGYIEKEERKATIWRDDPEEVLAMLYAELLEAA